MTSRRLLTPEAKLLLAAADRIEKFGWCQGVAQDAKGRMCVLAALSHGVIGGYEVYQAAVSKILKQAEAFEIAGWNDQPGRTKQEVVSMLRAAAIA